MTPFRFEHTNTFSREDYDRLERRSATPRSWRGWVRLGALAALASVLLFYRWTAPVGVLLLALLAVALVLSPQLTRWAQRRRFVNWPYLQGPTVHGVSERGLYFQGGTLRSESTWEGLRVWDRKDGYLMLSAMGVPAIYLPESALHEAGLYEVVLTLAQRHGVLFDSPESYKHPHGKSPLEQDV